MKKMLLISAALLAAAGMKAEVVEYDFNTNPTFFSVLYAPEDEDGWGWSGEYDIIDKTGASANTDGEMFNEKDEEEVWHAVTGRAISLADGMTYDLDEIDMSEPFLCWNQEGVGPTRVHIFNGWNSGDEYEDKDYGAATADDFIASKGALGLLRNANTGTRTGTYVQFPAVSNPTAMTLWIGNQGGNYHEMGLYAEVVPVIDGEAGEAIPVQGPEEYLAKRYYKLEVALPEGLAGDVAFQVGCGGSQVQIYHVAIEYGAENGVGSLKSDVANENAPVYNVYGVKVDDSYKGIVIKNGVKSIRR